MDPNVHNPQGTGQPARDDAAPREREEEEDVGEIGKAVGERVGRLRTKRQISQRQLQLEAGLGHGYLSNLEAGRVANPGIQQLYKVAVALGVPLAQLVTDESSASTGVEHPVHDSSSYAEGIVPSQTNVELEELQSRIEELWRLDKGRFAALMVVVSDMQEKAVDVAERNDSEQKPHRAAHRPARR